MERRTFLSWIGVGTLASSLPAVIVACSRDVSETSSVKFKTVGTVTDLDTNKFIFDESDLSQPILVLRNSETKEISAVDPKCTHQGCNVELDSERQILVCPCHNSQFSLDGEVINKPATKSLTTYEIQQEGEQIIVRIT